MSTMTGIQQRPEDAWMNTFMNFFEMLGINDSSSPAEIDNGYRTVIRVINPTELPMLVFGRDVLKDELKRLTYMRRWSSELLLYFHRGSAALRHSLRSTGHYLKHRGWSNRPIAEMKRKPYLRQIYEVTQSNFRLLSFQSLRMSHYDDI